MPTKKDVVNKSGMVDYYKVMPNKFLIYFGSSYKHCQHDLADH
jgi:hypothetical protein